MSATAMTILGAITAATTAALGFADLPAVFGSWEPAARFAMTTIGTALSYVVGYTHPGTAPRR